MRSLAALIFTAGLLCAQTSPVTGNWQGTLDVGPMKLRLLFHITSNGSGLTTKLDSLDQNARGIPVETTEFAAGKLKMNIAVIKGSFEGAPNASGTEITGTFSQNGMSFPLKLVREETVAVRRRPQTPKPPFPYDSLDATIDTTDGKLAGTLTVPKGDGPFPAALLISGSGPQDRDETIFEHKPFAVIADALTRKGIAVLRVDDRGIGASQGKSTDQTMDAMAADAVASIAYLKLQKKIDAKHIGVIGHSEGGIVGPIAALRSQDIRFVVMLAGPGVSGGDLLRAQADAVRKSIGAPAAASGPEQQLQNVILTAIEQESDPAAARKKMVADWQKLRESFPAEVKSRLEDPAVSSRIEHEFDKSLSAEMRAIIRSKPAETLRELKIPVLAVIGSRDLQVPPEQNLQAISAALAEAGNKDYKVTSLPGLNHLFQKCTACTVAEYGELEETFSPEALDMISDWILSRAK